MQPPRRAALAALAWVALLARSAGASTCAAPISANCAGSSSAGSHADPHLHFAHGGEADFRGTNGTFYALLSAPGVSFAAQTRASDFLLPSPLLVHGSFFTEAGWVLRGGSGKTYAVHNDANRVGFDVFEIESQEARLLVSERGVWSEWKRDGIRVFFKQSTIFVRANGWETNATRRPIYNQIRGTSRWRLDIALRVLGGHTGLETQHGTASETCFPHGLLGQSFDQDDIAVDGAKDSYQPADGSVEVTTRAEAEGAIEGTAADYVLAGRFGTAFAFSRFAANAADACAKRNVGILKGPKKHRSGRSGVVGAN